MFVASPGDYILPRLFATEVEAEAAVLAEWMKACTIFGLVWEGEDEVAQDEVEFLRQNIPNFDARRQGRDCEECLAEFRGDIVALPGRGFRLRQERVY